MEGSDSGASTALFELELVGGPWGRRLAKRRAGFDDLPWADAREGATDAEIDAARWVWTQSAFSETASAAAFAEIASALLAAGAPINLVAASGDFVADEVIHAELSARMAAALGGAVRLKVDLAKLARPAAATATPLMRAAELVVRTSCVGEALTLPVLKATKAGARSRLLRAVVGRIARDEAAHAELGGWFLDWAAPRLTDGDRDALGQVAADAVRAFAPVFGAACESGSRAADLGVLDCARFDPVFAGALEARVIAPLAARGIEVRV